MFHSPDLDLSPYLMLPDSSFVKHKLLTCGGGSISTVSKRALNIFWRSWVIPDCGSKTHIFPPSLRHIANKRLIDTCCIYSVIQYKLNLGFKSHYIHPSGAINLLQGADFDSSRGLSAAGGWTLAAIWWLFYSTLLFFALKKHHTRSRSHKVCI